MITRLMAALVAALLPLDIVTVMGGTRLVKSNPRIVLVTRPGVTVTKASRLVWK